MFVRGIIKSMEMPDKQEVGNVSDQHSESAGQDILLENSADNDLSLDLPESDSQREQKISDVRAELGTLSAAPVVSDESEPSNEEFESFLKKAQWGLYGENGKKLIANLDENLKVHPKRYLMTRIKDMNFSLSGEPLYQQYANAKLDMKLKNEPVEKNPAKRLWNKALSWFDSLTSRRPS